MTYEIEFIGLQEETNDATAICMRWINENGSYTIGVFDGGFALHGKELVNHLNKYYFETTENREIDFVICSHPHMDHASGLVEILENFSVKRLYMNLPWTYVDELYDKVSDKRITPASLEVRLKERYNYITNLEQLAIDKEIPIYTALEGTKIEDKLTILSPNKDFYLELLIESDKTPLEKKSSILEMTKEFIKKAINILSESWSEENLREGVVTEPDNETSTVILGEMNYESFLLTGDVGIRGLQKSIDYSNSIGKPIRKTVTVYEIPHHGSRHNINSSILNQLLGEILNENEKTNKKAFVCSGKNSNHPLQMVVNAFKRRGVDVYKASGKTICHHSGDMPKREGWTSAKGLEFNPEVEDWD